jgi:hypothetical protein
MAAEMAAREILTVEHEEQQMYCQVAATELLAQAAAAVLLVCLLVG